MVAGCGGPRAERRAERVGSEESPLATKGGDEKGCDTCRMEWDGMGQGGVGG